MEVTRTECIIPSLVLMQGAIVNAMLFPIVFLTLFSIPLPRLES
jgi:hypothetical protein